jgi:hypothetical protein
MQVLPKTLPAPLRGLILNEKPGLHAAGCGTRARQLVPDRQRDPAARGTQKWTRLGVTGTPDNQPIRSMFNYIAGSNKKMFAANATKLYDVTAAGSFGIPVAPRSTRTTSRSPMATSRPSRWRRRDGSTYLLAVNDAGEYALRFNGSTWQQLRPGATTPPSLITGPAGTAGRCRARSYSGLEIPQPPVLHPGGTMNAWYLPVYAVGGALEPNPALGRVHARRIAAVWLRVVGFGGRRHRR